MSKPRHIQKPNGQLAGSIGIGKDVVPVETGRPAAPTPNQAQELPDPVAAAWEHYQRQTGPSSHLEEIDALSASVIDSIMRLRDEELTARTSLTEEGRKRADLLADQAAALHASVLRAREDLRRVRETLATPSTTVDIPGVRAVIDADLLAYEVTQVASALQERSADVTPAALERAEQSVSDAARLLRRALQQNG